MKGRAALVAAVCLASVLLSTGCTAGGDAQADQRTLVFSDEFDGRAGQLPDAAKWSFETGGAGWGNRELECYTSAPGNAAENGSGSLVISAIYQPAHVCSDGNHNDYTSAKINTLNSFSRAHGSFEVRAKLPPGTGAWPAFWAQGTDLASVGWPQSGEIDVLEAKGGASTTTSGAVYGSVHGPLADGAPMYLTVTHNTQLDLSADFHTYSVDWSSTQLVFAVDGTPYGTITKDEVLAQGGGWVFDKPFYLMLNLAVGGNFTVHPTSDFGAAQHFTIDWVRVYE